MQTKPSSSSLSVGITQDAEVILQPFGSFLANRTARRYDVLNRSATSILLHHAIPRSAEEMLDWAESKGIARHAAIESRKMLMERGYLGIPCPSPQISPLPTHGPVRATRAEIEVTNRCNLRCVYCYAEANRSKVELSTAQWIEILTGMHKNGLRAVLFSGGEPFMHRGFMDILAWAGDRMVIEINSNGRYISPQVAQRLKELPIKSVQISLDSADPEHHDELRGRGSHAYAVAAISNLVEVGVSTVASAVVTSANRDQVPALREFVHSLGAQFKGDPVTRTGYAREIEPERWSSDFAASRADRIAESSEVGFEPICQSQVGYVAVSHTGTLKPCNMREAFFEPTGDLLVLGAEDKWWTRPYGETRVSSSARRALTITANLPGNNDGHYVCELQKAIIKDIRASEGVAAHG